MAIATATTTAATTAPVTTTTTTTRFPGSNARFPPGTRAVTSPKIAAATNAAATTKRRTIPIAVNQSQVGVNSPRLQFWNGLNKIRTNEYEFVDNTQQTRNMNNGSSHNNSWTFRSRKSHILDTQANYQWSRELNCFQAQSLPEEIFPHNTLEIVFTNTANNDSDNNNMRIRFGALEGLRGWMALDAPPIVSMFARDNAHWRAVMEHGRLPSTTVLGTSKNNKKNGNNDSEEPEFSNNSYDYAFTTPYKGGVDRKTDYNFLAPDSSSFVPRHNNTIEEPASDGQSPTPNASAAKGAGKKSGINFERAKLRKPICKCKSDGGRAPFVSNKNSNNDSNNTDSNNTSDTGNEALDKEPSAISRPSQTPIHWKQTNDFKVDIEGMLARCHGNFLFREDVDLWMDDMHDNGETWLKARCFVCHEGWACLLRNFVRVDGVLLRVVDTRYIHTFGTSAIHREHSWREGPWDPLVRAVQRDGLYQVGSAINDSIATRYLPLLRPPITETLSLVNEATTKIPQEIKPSLEQQQQQLVMIHDATIDDSIPVPNEAVEKALGISFVLKRSKGSVLEAIYSLHQDNDSSSDKNTLQTLWSKPYDTASSGASILSVKVSPNPDDGGRLAIGDDRGMVKIWRLSTGAELCTIPVAPQGLLDRVQKNPYFESTKLWVEHLVWSKDGTKVGAAAAKKAILVDASDGRLLSTLESASGTVTGLAFRKDALAVASYGEVCWLVNEDDKDDDKDKNNKPNKLMRKGAAIECIDVSPYGQQVAVGFLDKTLRLFYIGTNRQTNESQTSAIDVKATTSIPASTVMPISTAMPMSATRMPPSTAMPTTTRMPPSTRLPASSMTPTSTVMPNATRMPPSTVMPTTARMTMSTAMPPSTRMPASAITPSHQSDGTVDWVGFSGPVKSVLYSPKGKWLAAMGGSTVLVLRSNLSSRHEAPIVCRTPGTTTADGGDGTCHKFASISWSKDDGPRAMLAALDAQTNQVHVFRLSNKRTISDQTSWPVRAVPVLTVTPSFLYPSVHATTRFAFFSTTRSVPLSQEEDEVEFLVFDRNAAIVDDTKSSSLPHELKSKLVISSTTSGGKSGDNSAKAERFTIRSVV